MSRRVDKYHGILLLQKPAGISSHGAVERIRTILSQRSVGHAGTLDPSAEGLLVLLLGIATKVARYLTEHDKEYEAEVRLGLQSATYDAEGIDSKAEPEPVPDLDETGLENLLSEFRGSIRQQVPPYSAVHLNGERLYKLSRKGQDGIQLPERTVHIHQLELLSFEADRLRLRIRCSKGTYIRSLAHDIGRRLGCGGYLSFLRRTAVGSHRLAQAHTFEQVQAYLDDGRPEEVIIPIAGALRFSCLTVDDRFCRRVSCGVRPTVTDIAGVQGDFVSGDTVLIKNRRGSVLAIGTATVASAGLAAGGTTEVVRYERVLA